MKATIFSLCFFLILLSEAYSVSLRHRQGFTDKITLTPSNYPDYRLRMRSNAEVWIDLYSTIQSQNQPGSMVFNYGSGLCGVAGTVSFESVTSPGSYLRHQNGLLFVHRNDNSALFKKDACFYVREPLASVSDGYSFESVNYPGEYIRHQSFRVKKAAKENTDLYRHDATWIMSYTK